VFCALIMLGLALYGFVTAQVIIPLSSGRMILTGIPAYCASAGELLLGIGIASMPQWTARCDKWTIGGVLAMAGGAIVVWIGTLMQ
jgi:hypothetical protein